MKKNKMNLKTIILFLAVCILICVFYFKISNIITTINTRGDTDVPGDIYIEDADINSDVDIEKMDIPGDIDISYRACCPGESFIEENFIEVIPIILKSEYTGKELRFYFGDPKSENDSLIIEGEMPISEGAQIFFKYLIEDYSLRIQKYKAEIDSLKKAISTMGANE